MTDGTNAAATNRELLDTFLDFGIGHYYTLAKVLTSRVPGDLNDSERLSIGLEVSSLASAALDNLVRWYYAMRQWKARGTQTLLVDILQGAEIRDSHRLAALKHVKTSRTDEFCQAFGIPWGAQGLRELRIDAANWRFTVDQAKLNISKVLEDLTPARVSTERDWVVRYLHTVSLDTSVGQGADTYPADASGQG